jgi:phosphoserine phosphatase
MSNSAAFFDLDRTLMAGSSVYYFGKAAYREGLLPAHPLFADAAATLLFKSFGASDDKSESVRDRILASVAGTDADKLHRMAPAVVE